MSIKHCYDIECVDERFSIVHLEYENVNAPPHYRLHGEGVLFLDLRRKVAAYPWVLVAVAVGLSLRALLEVQVSFGALHPSIVACD